MLMVCWSETEAKVGMGIEGKDTEENVYKSEIEN